MSKSKNIFKDTFNVQIGDVDLVGRLLNLGDFAELADRFPEWQTDSIQDLIDIPKYRFRGIIAIIELGFEGLNDHIPEGQLMRLFNIREMKDPDSIPNACKMVLDSQDDEAEDQKEVAVKNSE